MVKSIVAIGGGQMTSRKDAQFSTTVIDQAIIELSGKKSPKLLFLPTASNDSEDYITLIEEYFGKFLHCSVRSLRILKENYTYEFIREQFLSSDIIYVGGGNTPFLIKMWKAQGIDKILIDAYNQGIVLSGLSAGAMCWFRFCNLKQITDKKDIVQLNGLNLIDLNLCPHRNSQPELYQQFKEILRDQSYGIAIDDYAAVIFQDNCYKVIASQPNAKSYLCYWRADRFYEMPLEHGTVGTLSSLLRGALD